MKRIELQALLCVGCLLAVEKVGKLWGTEEVAEDEVKEYEGVGLEVRGFVDENMGKGSMGLARE
jgi:hypothetical protein